MSGAEAAFVVGLISGVISIIEATKTVYDAAKDAKGQPEAFRQVASRLPLVTVILYKARERTKTLDETAQEALELTLESCKTKAEKLERIFRKAVRTDDDKWLDRYKKAVGTLGKQGRVEELMEGILKDIDVIACEKLVGTATDAEVKEIKEAMKQMKDMPSSLQDETGDALHQQHSGSGDNIGATGGAVQHLHKGTGHQYHNEIAGDAQFGINAPHSTVNITHHHNQQHLSNPQTQNCLRDLRTTDPRDDKKRIEETKGGLLKDSYCWILENPEFQRWYNDKQSRLLWIRGDPGKGKTMSLCGIINKLEETAAVSASGASSSCLLSYFFCQAADPRINSGTAVLRGLIYLLAGRRPPLLKHVRKKYDDAGKELFVDANAWSALSEIFTNILQDPGLESTYLIIDALDECVTGLPQLLQFIDETSPVCTRVKWIISSRNLPHIEEQLNLSDQKVQLRLELNKDSIATAVSAYIEHKVGDLAKRKKYNPKLENSVRDYLFLNADATFLWVALVLQELETVDRRNTLKRIRAFPSGLSPFYRQMMDQVTKSDDADLYRRILSIVAVVYRPITLRELVSLNDALNEPDNVEDLSEKIEDLEQTIGQCGSFLTIQEGTIYFVHQSAKDFLLQENTSRELFPSGKAEVHFTIFSRSREIMSRTLRRDIYGLRHPGFPIDKFKQPDPDPLSVACYSCVYWVDHLCDTKKDYIEISLSDNGIIHDFLKKHFLHWMEGLSLLKSIFSGIRAVYKLENFVRPSEAPNLYAFIRDAKRFTRYYQSLIEKAPLQLYCSALVFAPEKSIIRRQFEKCIPSWIQRKPIMRAHWNEVLQILEGHSNTVTSVAFSPDGKQVVSGSWDHMVRLWDATTGELLQTLEGHSDIVTSVAFSPDSKQVISRSEDKIIQLWNVSIGVQRQMLEGHFSRVTSIAFSPNSKKIVSGSHDKTVRLWDATTGELLETLKGHFDTVISVAFSPNGKQVVSGSYDRTVQLWDAATGALLQKLEGHVDTITSVAFSPDGKQIVSGSDDKTVRLWDTATGALLQLLEGHSSWVTLVAFSPNGKLIVSGSDDETLKLWDATTGSQLQTLEGHSSGVLSVAFSPNGKQIVSGSHNKTVRLWDATTGKLSQLLEGHSSWVRSVAFSPDSKQIVSGSDDGTVRLWDAARGVSLKPTERHFDKIISVAFSPDGKQIVSNSNSGRLRLWDATTGSQLQTLEGPFDIVTSVAFSPDGKQIVSKSNSNTVRLWNANTGELLQTLKGHVDTVMSVAFSPDGKQIVSGSNGSVRLWDATTGIQLQTLEGHVDTLTSVAFSPDGKQIVSGSNGSVRLWDATTGIQLQMLEGHVDKVTSVAFSPDGKQIVSGSKRGRLRLWDATTGVQLQTLEGHFDTVTSVAILPDGKQVVSKSKRGRLRLRDATTGVWLETLKGHFDIVTSVAISPDGKQVVSGSDGSVQLWDATTGVQLWDAMTGVQLQNLKGHVDRVTSVAFSPNGKQIVSGSNSKLQFWDVATGSQLQPLELYFDKITSVAFSPGSKLLLSLRVSSDWVVEGSSDILWLPPDYLPTCAATWNGAIVLGHLSGRISLFTFAQGIKLKI